MEIAAAQREVRTVFLGELVGQLVSASIWAASAALATWRSPRLGILALVVGGAFIFPLTQLVLRLSGRRASLSPANALTALAMQVAFTIPLSLPLVLAATLHRLDWFYPAMMVVVGAHYLPFVFLYGMPHFAVLGAALIGAGVAIGMFTSGAITLGAWVTAAALVVFGLVGYALVQRETAAAAIPAAHERP